MHVDTEALARLPPNDYTPPRAWDLTIAKAERTILN